jgi:parallel beta-helix repeat protein
MNERLLEGILLTFLLASTLVTALGSQRVTASDELPLIYIRGDGSIEPNTVPIQQEGSLYTLTGDITEYDGIVIERNDIILDGARHLFDGCERAFHDGVTLEGRENVTIKNMIIKRFAWYCIHLSSSSSNFILANDIASGSRYGGDLMLESSSNNLISGNNITDSYQYYCGIFLSSSSNNNTIIGNNIQRHDQSGIGLHSSSNNIISGNTIADNGRYDGGGIWLGSSSNNSIVGNTIDNNSCYGISLDSSTNDRIVGNNITNNAFFPYDSYNNGGIVLDSSTYNSISGNTIADNDGAGIWLRSSSNNSIYHNNFDNTQQVNGSSSTNLWDNGCEGNYWSDYNGTDSDFDGIGDTPYIIDSNNTDHCPLMNRYWIPADVNHDLIVNIFDAVRICAAYGTIPSDPEWNPHADIAEPFGKIGILDAVLCTSHYGEQYP